MLLIETRILRNIRRRDVALSREDEEKIDARHIRTHAYAGRVAGAYFRVAAGVPVRSCGMLVCEAPSLPFQCSNRL